MGYLLVGFICFGIGAFFGISAMAVIAITSNKEEDEDDYSD